MARYAIVIGANSIENPLKYAEKDAVDIAKCLKGIRYGFEVTLLIGETKYQTIETIDSILAKCLHDDTIIIYFAGHGRLERGQLFLHVDNFESNIHRGAIQIESILNSLRHCLSNNKLIMLDCCHAGGAINFRNNEGQLLEDATNKQDSDNHIIFVASERLLKVREYDILGGSFFTKFICKGLEARFNEIDKDNDQHITVNDLVAWLKQQHLLFNASQRRDHKAPLPYIISQQKGLDFKLTQNEYVWKPYELTGPNGIPFVVLPVLPSNGKVLCISKFLTTNAQYAEFVNENNYDVPVGQFLSEEGIRENTKFEEYWQDNFYPWNDQNFNHSSHPVVCVSYLDGNEYCKWINNKFSLEYDKKTYVFLPTEDLWQFAAYGEIDSRVSDFSTTNHNMEFHHNSLHPGIIDNNVKKFNKNNVSEMFGNVWEWCSPKRTSYASGMTQLVNNPKLQGGGFHDDLNIIIPVLDSNIFPGRQKTRRFDLGFRVAAFVPLDSLPENVQVSLSLIPNRTQSLWLSIPNFYQ